eukprot:SAG11_NODE_13670_length_644_cov_1.133945_2_plen_137_part_01
MLEVHNDARLLHQVVKIQSYYRGKRHRESIEGIKAAPHSLLRKSAASILTAERLAFQHTVRTARRDHHDESATCDRRTRSHILREFCRLLSPLHCCNTAVLGLQAELRARKVQQEKQKTKERAVERIGGVAASSPRT